MRKATGKNRPHKLPEEAVLQEFIRLVRAGKKPSIAGFLKGYPQYAKSLRQAMEGMLLLDREYRKFHRRHPDVDLEELFQIPKTR
jgi:hypothetical protein